MRGGFAHRRIKVKDRLSRPRGALRRGARGGRGDRARCRRHAPHRPHAAPAWYRGSAACWSRGTADDRRRVALAAALLSRSWRWSVPIAAHAWTPGHPHLSRRVGPGEPAAAAGARSPICSGPFPSTSCTATSPPTPPSRRSTRRSAGTATPGTSARRSTISPPTDALRAFGLGYLCHLAADTVAHNYFVPRQLGADQQHARRRPLPTGRAGSRPTWATTYARTAKEVILLDHTPADAHLDRIISPRRFSACAPTGGCSAGWCTSPRRRGWQRAFQVAREHSRWDLPEEDVERHMALSFEYVMEMLATSRRAGPRHLDPSGAERAPRRAARKALAVGCRTPTASRDTSRIRKPARSPDFGLPRKAT